MAPERVSNKTNINPAKADVFSLGMVFLHLLATFDITQNLNMQANNAKLLKIVKDEVKAVWAQDLLKAMFFVNPDDRPPFRDLLAYIDNVRTLSLSRSLAS